MKDILPMTFSVEFNKLFSFGIVLILINFNSFYSKVLSKLYLTVVHQTTYPFIICMWYHFFGCCNNVAKVAKRKTQMKHCCKWVLKLFYKVSPKSFLPPPTVKSALLRVERKDFYVLKDVYLVYHRSLTEPSLARKKK